MNICLLAESVIHKFANLRALSARISTSFSDKFDWLFCRRTGGKPPNWDAQGEAPLIGSSNNTARTFAAYFVSVRLMIFELSKLSNRRGIQPSVCIPDRSSRHHSLWQRSSGNLQLTKEVCLTTLYLSLSKLSPECNLELIVSIWNLRGLCNAHCALFYYVDAFTLLLVHQTD